MTFEIVQSSPQATAVAKDAEAMQTRYPFDKLQPLQSFTIKLEDLPNWQSLRTCVYQRNSRERAKKSGVEFKFIKHTDLGIVEVSRLS